MEQQQQQVSRIWKGEGREQSHPGGVFHSLLQGVCGSENMTIDQCEAIREMDDSQLIGAPAAKVDVGTTDVRVRNAAAAGAEISTVKKRRGRPPRNQGKLGPPPLKAMEEEDVCFICFDGGSLVLCDRRGCPKAYHPACIKRNEAFFQSKAKWNCGWHICSSCERASHFMCYTCNYSLCKGCAKDADYLRVRGNKGFCRTCMKMIMLIENVPAENSEQVQVDFDDNTSWEYLFKVYWVSLKESLLLTVDEIQKAKNAGQVNELPKTRSPWKVPALMDPVSESFSELCCGGDDKATSSGNSYGSLDTNYSKRRKYDVEPKVLSNETSVGTDKSSVSEVAPLPEGMKWATKELLEFVAHVRNGDTSFLSQFDVQVLLLEYIKRNNLRGKCQILCDTRLINLLGKTHVGQIEMLKLLEYHFLVKEKPFCDESVRVDIAVAAAAAAEASCTDPSEGIANGSVVNNDRRCETHKRMDEKGTHINPTPDEYAAIDVHNINLLYLKLSSMENLMIDADTFHKKVVGSFVRIRIPCGDQQQDVHRLVKVVGTDKTAQSYKLGSRTTDIMLQIMNLDKKEVVSIDGISDQDFSEEECKRLRLSVESGLVELMKVGEIQDRAMALHSVKVTDFLESEISQLNQIWDQACGNGRQKKKYLEKLEILHSAEERQRRLTEVPFVHSDPNMGPCCKLEGNVKVTNDHIKFNHEGLGSSSHGQNIQAMAPSEPISAGSSVIPIPPATTEGVISFNDNELQRLWNYRDPFGTVQGPFRMVQLRNWNTSGLFPLDLRVWMMNGKEEESVLLTDALLGSFQKEIITDRSNKDSKWDCASSQDTATTPMDENIVHQNGQPEKKDSSSMNAGDGEITSSKELGSRSSRLTRLLDLVIGSDELDQNSEQLCDLSKTSNSGGSPSTSAKVCNVEMLHVTPVDGEENKSTSVNDVKRSPHKTDPEEQTVVEEGDENKVKNEGCSSQSSGQSWHPTRMSISYGWDLNSTFPSMVHSNGEVKKEQEVSFSEVGSSLPKEDNMDTKGEQKDSVSCNVSIIDTGPSWSTSSSLVGGTRTRFPDVAAEWTGGYPSVPAEPCVEDWGSSLVSASSLRISNGSSGSGADELRHTSLSHASIDAGGWQAMVSEPNEFSLVDESVSDLLAEVEAMESLGGFPSPTSKLMHVSDDRFSPVENFSHGRSDALSSTGDIQMSSRLEEKHGLSVMRCQPMVPREKAQNPPQLTVTEPFHISLSGRPSNKVERGTGLHNGTANWWEGSSETQAHQSKLDLEIQLPSASNVSHQVEAIATASVDLRFGNSRGRSIIGLAPGIGNTSSHSGTQHSATSTGHSTTSTGNPSLQGSQPNEHSGYGSHYYQTSRDSGYGRERSTMWNGNNRQSGSLRSPPKGQRVCKFYESGCCKKGSCCSFWHPSS